MPLYSQLLLLTNHGYALVAHYHVRFFYSSIIFFFLYLSLWLQKYLCNRHIWNCIFLCSFLWQIKSVKCNIWDYMKCSVSFLFFSPLLIFLSSTLPHFPPSFILQNTKLLFDKLFILICIHFILELPSFLTVSCLSPLKMFFS